MRLIVHDTEIKYEPSFNDFELSLINIIEIIIKSCSHVPRVETRLYSDSAVSFFQLVNLLFLKIKKIN
jgi:hypothetical protein